MDPKVLARRILELDSSDREHADAAREIYEPAVRLAIWLLREELARAPVAVSLAQPQPDEAAEIRAALVRQDEAKWKLVHAGGGDAELARAAGEYLDATDALYRSQINVPRVFA